MAETKHSTNHLHDTFPITPEDGQKHIDKWFNNLPFEIAEIREKLNLLLPQFEIFQLIANISHLNHLREMDKPYTYYNEGRMAVIPELISLWLLKNDYQPICSISPDEFKEQVDKVNDLASKYLGMSDALKTMTIMPDLRDSETTLQKVTNKLTRDETWVRNPGFPDHHFEIADALFKPFNQEIKNRFGFTIEDSIVIRKNQINLQNQKFKALITEADRKGIALKDEVVKFRNTGYISSSSLLSKEQFYELQGYSSKKLKPILIHHFRTEVFYQLQKVYALTVDELAKHLELGEEVVKSFMDYFSCSFNSSITDESLIGANVLLKTKPVIKYVDKYIIPSFSMLIWCVEPAIEEYIKTSPKLSNKYKDLKHDFLLKKGMELLKQIMPTATFYPENLYYILENGDMCETDGLISYNNTLFIIEAKGQRISTKSKAGNYQRTENHLKEIIGDATAQGKRTLDYIKSKKGTSFHTKQKEQVIIDHSKYTDFITISLTLEPIGNLTPLMKVSNDLNYFTDQEFPWIVSIYDLIVFADHFEMPILFLHYLKRRKRFLEVQNVYVFEEIDLLGYYLSNGLYIEHMLKRAENENIHMLSFDNHTDEFNDYYMYKYGHKETLTPKIKSFLSDDFKTILASLEQSTIYNKTAIMLELLDISSTSIKKLTDYIKTMKTQFAQDGEIHDCSIGTTHDDSNIGITYMVGPNETGVNDLLLKYCNFKMNQRNAVLWIGIGDVSEKLTEYNFKCSLILRNAN